MRKTSGSNKIVFMHTIKPKATMINHSNER